MVCTRLALWLLKRADGRGSREALVGDLLEELGRGQSRLWVCEQLLGFYRVALLARVRRPAQVTPLLIAIALAAILLGSVSIASPDQVVQTWMSIYYVAGTLSLFAHVMSRATASRPLLLTEDADRD